MCTNFYGSVFTVENLFSIAPECGKSHFGETQWPRPRFKLDKKHRDYLKEGTNHKKKKNLSSPFHCIYHVTYQSNGLNVIISSSRVLFGKSIAAAPFKKYVHSCRKKVLSSMPQRPVVGLDSYLFQCCPYLHNSLPSISIPILFSHLFPHERHSQHFQLLSLMPHQYIQKCFRL